MGHDEGRSGQRSGHRGFSRAVSGEVKQSGPREGGRGQVLALWVSEWDRSSLALRAWSVTAICQRSVIPTPTDSESFHNRTLYQIGNRNAARVSVRRLARRVTSDINN